jgi:hypothetical protein
VTFDFRVNLLLELFGLLEKKEWEVYMMALYHIWLTRNDAIHEPTIENHEKISRWTLAMVDER